MEIRSSQLSLIGQTASGADSSRPLPPLQPGQRLEAWVLAHPSASRIILDTGGRRLIAESNLPLQPGDHLELEVVSTHEGVAPRLKIVSQSRSSTQLIAQTLRTLLPKQESMPQAFNKMKALINNPEILSRLPPTVVDPLVSLMDSLPLQSDLIHPDTLKTALRHSGLLHESLRTQSESSSKDAGPTDLKGKLLQLAQVLRTPPYVSQRPNHAPQPGIPSTKDNPSPPSKSSLPEPPFNSHLERPSAKIPPGVQLPSIHKAVVREHNHTEETLSTPEDPMDILSKKTSAALARIVLDQLASLPKTEGSNTSWHFELPFRHGEIIETLQLIIQGEVPSQKNPPQEPCWSVIIKMEPPSLGKIEARVILQEGKLNVFLWSKSAHTNRLFKRYLEKLAENFLAQGLQPNQLQTMDGPPPPTPHPTFTPPLLDERI